MSYPENVNDISQQLESEARAKFPQLSNSSVAEWKLWTGIMAIAIRAIQVVVDNFRAVVEQRLTYLRPGTLGWYVEISRSFQFGYSLQIKDDGSLGYTITDESARIVSAVAISESEDAVVIKVAKTDGSNLIEFTPSERLAFQNYIESVKFVGTKTNIVSTAADMVRYQLVVYYDPAFDVSVLQTNIDQALISYKDNLGFDGVIFTQRLLQILLAVPGVVTLSLNSFTVAPSGGGWSSIGLKYETQAGYFNYDYDNSSLVLTPVNEL